MAGRKPASPAVDPAQSEKILKELTEKDGEVSVQTESQPVPNIPKQEFPVPLRYEEGTHIPLKTLQALSQYPFFSLKEEKVIKSSTIVQKLSDGSRMKSSLTIDPGSETGLPTFSDLDLVIFVISEIRKKVNAGELSPNWFEGRVVSINLRDFLTFRRGSGGGVEYKQFEQCLDRLTNSRITFNQEFLSEFGDVSKLLSTKTRTSFINQYELKTVQEQKGKGINQKGSTSVTIEFSKWFWDLIYQDNLLLSLDEDYMSLSNFKKAVFSKVKKSLGWQPFFRIKLQTLALSLGVISSLDKVEEEKQALYDFRRNMRLLIAEDDLINIKVGIEDPRKGGNEMLIFYNRDWKSKLTPDYNPRTNTYFTELEFALLKAGGERMLDWFYTVNHAPEMRELLKNNKTLIKRQQHDQEILAAAKKGKKLAKKDTYRLKLLKRIYAMEHKKPDFAKVPTEVPVIDIGEDPEIL